MAFEPGQQSRFTKDIDKMSKDCKNDKRFPKICLYIVLKILAMQLKWDKPIH